MVNEERLRVRQEDVDTEDLAIDLYEQTIARGASAAEAIAMTLRAFPDHAALIADYAFTQEAANTRQTAADAAADARIMARADALIASRLSASKAPSVPLTGLIDRARAHGLDLVKLSASLGLARSVLVKLDRRLIDAATVPAPAIQRIAVAIGCAADDLRAYLSGPPTLAAGASYRSKTAPDLADSDGAIRREPFARALGTAVASREMQQAQVDEWLDE
ncbi:MAG: hypothetical protein P4L33_00155 [Capsulimonadaceae bacterium]|nr:hypothetical protein [Capsulimonadaceae bacterium]